VGSVEEFTPVNYSSTYANLQKYNRLLESLVDERLDQDQIVPLGCWRFLRQCQPAHKGQFHSLCDRGLFMLPFIAIPLLHSSGAWIASTAAGGYIAGTLSSTWVGAFVAGNAGILSGIGITSAAGVYAALGGTLSSAGTALGSGLSAIGLSGLAQSLGLAPATLLGLTFFSWAIVASALLVISGSGLIYFFAREKLQLINDERSKGGLSDTTWREILKEVQNYEKQAMTDILKKLGEEGGGIVVHRDGDMVEIKGVNYGIRDLKYIIEKDGAEVIVKPSFISFKYRVVCTVKEARE
jgi:hypothetical protein